MTTARHNVFRAAGGALIVALTLGAGHLARATPGDGLVLLARDNGAREVELLEAARERLESMRIATMPEASVSERLEGRIRSGDPWPIGEPAPARLAAIVDLLPDGQTLVVSIVRIEDARVISRQVRRPGQGQQKLSETELVASIARTVSLAADPPRIISARRSGIVINAGTERGLSGGMTLEVYQLGEERIDLETGRTLRGEETYAGRIRLDRAVERLSEASLVSGNAASIGVGAVCRLAIDEPPARVEPPEKIPHDETNDEDRSSVETNDKGGVP